MHFIPLVMGKFCTNMLKTLGLSLRKPKMQRIEITALKRSPEIADPHASRLPGTATQLHRAALLGQGIRCEYGRLRGGCHPAGHPQSGAGSTQPLGPAPTLARPHVKPAR